MIVDEIFTGFGRTGTWFAVEREGVVPDILCVGKAMGSGFPISAAIGRAEIMDAWPLSTGEALHTSTYLGNPMGCAAALATFEEIERRRLPARASAFEPFVGSRLAELRSRRIVKDVRGRGLFWGVQLADAAIAETAVRRALQAGLILLQSGSSGDVIAISPPLVITRRQLARALRYTGGSSRRDRVVACHDEISHRHRGRRIRRQFAFAGAARASALRGRGAGIADDRRSNRRRTRHPPRVSILCGDAGRLRTGCRHDCVPAVRPRARRLGHAGSRQTSGLRKTVCSQRRRCGEDGGGCRQCRHGVRHRPRIPLRRPGSRVKTARRQPSPRPASKHRDHLFAPDLAPSRNPAPRMVVRARTRRRPGGRYAIAPHRQRQLAGGPASAAQRGADAHRERTAARRVRRVRLGLRRRRLRAFGLRSRIGSAIDR